MALVAYDNSDSSEYEEEDENSTVASSTKQVEVSDSISTSKPEPPPAPEVDSDTKMSLFNLLPQPSRKKPAVVEEDDEFLHKKETASNVKQKARITVPSLSDFKDVADRIPSAKPKTTIGKKSGLLSMLPQPKNAAFTVTTKSLIPNVLTKKAPTPSNVKKKQPGPPMPSVKTTKVEKSLLNDYSDDSDTDDVQNDFFSINKANDIPYEELPLDVTPDTSLVKEVKVPSERKTVSIESYFKKNEVEDVVFDKPQNSNEAEYYEQASANNGYETNSNEAVLDEEAILKLCGTRGKRKREDIQIVDVNQQEVLADAREWLIKGLMDDTTKRVSSSKKRGNEPTSQQKRKHQITYLAHQAKANEAELQNQWANNRMSKRQTQSKYGF